MAATSLSGQRPWAAVERVLKPGGYLLAFGGTRTYHRLACAIEDAGFEIRDAVQWLYGSGFPKSHDVSKAIDRVRDWSKVEALNEEIRRARTDAGLSLAEIGAKMQATTAGQYGKWYHRGGHMFFETGRSLPSRPEWERLRTVLPIAPEFANVYDAAERQVLGETTYSRDDDGSWAANCGHGMFTPGDRTHQITAPATEAARQWQGWGTALKPSAEIICVARKPLSEGTVAANVLRWDTGAINVDASRVATGDTYSYERRGGSPIHNGGQNVDTSAESHPAGRWPANVAHDGSPEVLQAFARQSERAGMHSAGSACAAKWPRSENKHVYGKANHGLVGERYGDTGTAARFYFCAKASAWERANSRHPTIKPIALMEWLVRMVTPPGGRILDPFAGSGSTLIAAERMGFDAVGIELRPEAAADAERRIKVYRARRMIGDAQRVEPLPGQMDMAL